VLIIVAVTFLCGCSSTGQQRETQIIDRRLKVLEQQQAALSRKTLSAQQKLNADTNIRLDNLERELKLISESVEDALARPEEVQSVDKFELEKVDPKQEITKTFNNEIKTPIRSNEMLLSMIILYIMENSIVHKRDDVESYVRLSLTHKENHLIIVVEDNGIGIPAKIKPKIFNMFFRGSEQSKGNGLGLYLVKKAVDILSGTCHVSSRVDKFTKMVVRIPLA